MPQARNWKFPVGGFCAWRVTDDAMLEGGAGVPAGVPAEPALPVRPPPPPSAEVCVFSVEKEKILPNVSPLLFMEPPEDLDFPQEATASEIVP